MPRAPHGNRKDEAASKRRVAPRPARAAAGLVLPRDVDNVVIRATAEQEVRLTNLRKLFWAEPPLTKGDLLQYYADVSPWLLPHLHDRAMVMKRYPHGAAGTFFS